MFERRKEAAWLVGNLLGCNYESVIECLSKYGQVTEEEDKKLLIFKDGIEGEYGTCRFDVFVKEANETMHVIIEYESDLVSDADAFFDSEFEEI